MFKHVDTVLIGKNLPASYSTVDALNAGDVALFNENGVLITTAANAADAKELYIGVAQEKVNVTIDGEVEQKANIKMSPVVKRGMKAILSVAAHKEPVQDKIVIDLTSATIVSGNRYVIRIIYKDIYEHPGQFSHTYEVFANGTTAATLASDFAAVINAHANRRVTASTSAAQLTLTAMPKDDNEGVYSVNTYTTVDMEATLYVTTPSALLGNYPESVPGATITKTAGNPGIGYWKQVRDAEIRNMGYQGHVYIGTYPQIRQATAVVEGTQYNVITLEYDNMYLSNDNQYIKTTPLVTELYVPGASVESSIVVAGIKNFIAGSSTASTVEDGRDDGEL